MTDMVKDHRLHAVSIGIRHQALSKYALACRREAWSLLGLEGRADRVQGLLEEALNAEAAAVRLREADGR